MIVKLQTSRMFVCSSTKKWQSAETVERWGPFTIFTTVLKFENSLWLNFYCQNEKRGWWNIYCCRYTTGGKAGAFNIVDITRVWV